MLMETYLMDYTSFFADDQTLGHILLAPSGKQNYINDQFHGGRPVELGQTIRDNKIV